MSTREYAWGDLIWRPAKYTLHFALNSFPLFLNESSLYRCKRNVRTSLNERLCQKVIRLDKFCHAWGVPSFQISQSCLCTGIRSRCKFSLLQLKLNYALSTRVRIFLNPQLFLCGRIRLPSTRIRWIRQTNPQLFESALQSETLNTLYESGNVYLIRIKHIRITLLLWKFHVSCF